jgi:hypothetical protein
MLHNSETGITKLSVKFAEMSASPYTKVPCAAGDTHRSGGGERGERERSGPLDLPSHLRTARSYTFFLRGQRSGGWRHECPPLIKFVYHCCCHLDTSFHGNFLFYIDTKFSRWQKRYIKKKYKNFGAAPHNNVSSYYGMLYVAAVP